MTEMKLFAVFGNPVLHSKSPNIFNSAFKDLGLNAFYTRIHPQSAEDIVKIIKDLPINGASITSPFKEDIIPYLDDISVDSQHIGAVNAVVNNNGKLIGYNTDHDGVVESLHESCISIAQSNCLVLGGGGAAKAAVYGLINHGGNVFICNRTYDKAQAITDKFGCELIDWDNFNTAIKFDIVVSTLLPQAIPPFLKSFKFNTLLDASYKNSKMSDAASKMNVKIISGKRWLIYQAVEAFELFCQEKPSVEAMEKNINNKVDSKNINISHYPDNDIKHIKNKNPDIIISVDGLNSEQQKQIIDEEVDFAFNC